MHRECYYVTNLGWMAVARYAVVAAARIIIHDKKLNPEISTEFIHRSEF